LEADESIEEVKDDGIGTTLLSFEVSGALANGAWGRRLVYRDENNMRKSCIILFFSVHFWIVHELVRNNAKMI
jgi:hypothetical protein